MTPSEPVTGDARTVPTQRPPQRASVVFVHGAWHGPWCWRRWCEIAEDHGYDAVAVTLPGHDRPGHRGRIWDRMSEYLAEVERTVANEAGPAVLIGHSMGGYVVQRVLERSRPSNIAGAALIASVPRRGVGATTARLIRRSPASTLAALLGADLYRAVGTPELCRQAFFSDSTPDDVVDRTLGQIQNESYLAFPTMLLRWVRPDRIRTPVMVMAGELDGIFSIREQRSLATAHGVEPVVIPGAGHDLMLEPGADRAASLLFGWIRERFAEAGA